MIIRICNVTKSYANKTLLKNINLTIQNNDKLALIGQNGKGKTTLIKCILGDEDYEGDIFIEDNIKIAVMEQDKNFKDYNFTFSEYIENKKQSFQKKLSEIETKFTDSEIIEDSLLFEKLLKEHSLLLHKIEGKSDENSLKDCLKELKFNFEDYNKHISDLSGGQRTKFRIAELLTKDTDFLILDEPTNHLDFETINWLEKKLRLINKPMIIISHDRQFIKKVCNRFVEIENKLLIDYNTDYESYIQRKRERFENLENIFIAKKREKARLESSIKEKRRWAHLHGSKKLKIIADNLERRKENLGEIENPLDYTVLYKLKFQEPTTYSKNIIKAKNIEKFFGSNSIIKESSFIIEGSKKIAIIGPNGCGKTTLMQIFANEQHITCGVLKIASEIKIGYFDQEFNNLNPIKTIKDYIWEVNDKLMEHEVINLLVTFGFRVDKIGDKIKHLSGGEKARLCLANLSVARYDLLLLDEPTNHLDIELIEILENALNKYQGTVIFVSHDRYFIDKVATELMVFKNKTLQLIKGNYSKNYNS